MPLSKNKLINLIKNSPSCTYYLDNIFLETDLITDQEKDFIRNCIYRQELLNTFDLEDFDEIILESSVRLVYTLVKNEQKFSNFIEILINAFPLTKEEECFMVLFSFDYFFITLECLKDFFKNGDISTFNQELLSKTIYSSFS